MIRIARLSLTLALLASASFGQTIGGGAGSAGGGGIVPPAGDLGGTTASPTVISGAHLSANTIPITALPQAPANTYRGNSTGATANVSDTAWPPCVGSTDALNTASGALTCNTAISASALKANATLAGHYSTQGSNPPTIGTCGTSPSLDAHASDSSGQLTVGTGSPTTCPLTFHTAYTTWVHCRASPETSQAGFGYSVTTTTLTITGTALTGIVDYACDGL